MSDSELDYMSDDILISSAKDIRPGLIYKQSLKRKYEVEKKQEEARKRSYTKPKKVLEAESRDAALNVALPPQNKGFQMLQKMGYQPGTSIGKANKGSAIIEPIKPVLKVGRSGLGKEEEVKRQVEQKVQKQMERHLQMVHNVEKITNDYVKRLREKQDEKKINRDLYLSQKACYQIESQMGHEKPKKSWFWPDIVHEELKDANVDESDELTVTENSDTEENEEEPFEKLVELTNHLRKNYFYCIWCGTHFDSEEDIQQNCPGPTSEDHD